MNNQQHAPAHLRGRKILRPFCLVGLLGTAILLPTAVQAQTECVPQANGVPGIPGPPDWSVPLPAPLPATAVDDPRWRGAARETFPNALAGTTPDVATRLIQGTGSLFIQYQAIGDATSGTVSNSGSGPVYWDAGYVAFADAAFTNVQVARIGVDSSGATAVYRWVKSGSTWVGAPVAPTWLTATTAWNAQTVSGMGITWTLNLRIATASLPGTKFWYATDTALIANASVETLAWPSAGGFTQPVGGPDTALPASTWGPLFDKIRDPNSDGVFTDSAWGDLLTYSGSTVPASCAGIRLEDNAIGTNQTPDYKIATNATNIFHAQLSTFGGAALPAAGAVKGRFRIANWGMTIGVNGSWSDISGGSYADNVINDAAGLLSFTCNGAIPCPALPVGAPSDQCLLVEVQGVSGPVSFLKDSAWRNMLFGTASRFEHEAEISLIGLTASSTPRDVYLSVKTHNMPSKVTTPPGTTPPGTTKPNQPSTNLDVKPNEQANSNQDPYLRYKLLDMLPTERLIAGGQPVYEVRGYRDTGKGTAPVQILKPMVPYGYIINHSGALVGWQHALTGVNTTVTELIPNTLYKISVLPGATAKIKDRIDAIETATQVPPISHCNRCNCEIRGGSRSSVFLGLLGLAGVVGARRSRRKRKGESR